MDLPVLGVDFDKLLTRVFDGFVIVVAFDIVDGLVLERRVERVVDVASRWTKRASRLPSRPRAIACTRRESRR